MTPRSSDKRPAAARAFLWHLLRAAPVIVCITAMTSCATSLGLLAAFEHAGVGFFLALRTPAESREVVLVTITNDDYQELFDARSPLNPGTLRQLIEAIRSSQPAVVGIDVLTAETSSSELRGLDDPRLVWVQDAAVASKEGEAATSWRPGRVLGTDVPPAAVKTGLAVFPRDRDGVIRRYYRELPVVIGGATTTRPSLSRALVSEYCRVIAGTPAASAYPGCGQPSAGKAGKPVWLNLAGDRHTFRKITAGAVLKDRQQTNDPLPAMRNAIVILGGVFEQGRDIYPTPIGLLSGMELTAFAVQSELSGGGIENVNHRLMEGVDLLAGVLLVALNWVWPPTSRWHALGYVAALMALALAGSWVVFATTAYWATFVPVGIGVWLHGLYDGARENRHARRALEEYKARYGPR